MKIDPLDFWDEESMLLRGPVHFVKHHVFTWQPEIKDYACQNCGVVLALCDRTSECYG